MRKQLTPRFANNVLGYFIAILLTAYSLNACKKDTDKNFTIDKENAATSSKKNRP